MITRKEITIYDIAKEMHVSPSTVSRALKGNPVINKETQRKITQCAERLGYQTNAFASNLRQKRTKTIGVIVPRLDSQFMSACLSGMEEVANQEGYTMIISQSLESLVKEQQNANTMFSNRVDGLIVSQVSCCDAIDHFQPFLNKGVPVVFFDRVPAHSNHVSFVIDNFKAAYEVGLHLIDQGCKNLLHVTLRSKNALYRDRFDGFKRAADEAGVSCQLIEIDHLNVDGGQEIAQQILNEKTFPDGVFVANDMAAAGCMLAFKSHGLSIPEDVAFVGFNNDPISTIVAPELSTIDYPGREAGVLTAQTLINYLKGEPGMEYTTRVVLNSKLIIRQSSLRKLK